MEKPGCALLATVVVILLLAAPVVLMNEIARKTQANQRAIAEAQAQVAAAARDRAYYDAVAQQARIEQLRAEGERAVLESAARAVDGQTEIVLMLADDYLAMNRQARRDPFLEYLPWLITAGVIGGVVLAGVNPGSALRRRSRERDAERLLRDSGRLPREDER